MKRYEYFIWEADFGASTSAILETAGEEDIITSAKDTSTYSTNYVWDGWEENELNSLIGLTISEAREKAKHRFDEFRDEFRQPYAKITEIEEE